MSIPYPPDFDQHLDEERHDRRYTAALKRVDAGDVIAEVESAVAEISDPKAHPIYGVVAYYLEAGGPETGRLPWCLDALAQTYDRLVKAALTKVIDAQLADPTAWEVD